MLLVFSEQSFSSYLMYNIFTMPLFPKSEVQKTRTIGSYSKIILSKQSIWYICLHHNQKLILLNAGISQP